jgi:uncharacterized protein with PIN domain
MENNKIKFYKNPLYVFGSLTVLTGLISIFIYKSSVSEIRIYFGIVPIILGVLTYFTYKSQCPNCKKILVKTEKKDWEEDMGIKKEPYTYFTRKFQYPDGSIDDDKSSEKTILREKKYDKHFFICNNCSHGSNKEWKEVHWVWIGEEPKSKIIKKKGNNVGFSINSFDDETYESNGKRKTIPKKVKEDLWIRHFGKKFKGDCFVCNNVIETHKFEAGHIKSVAKGGSDNISNLKPICMKCNRSMGTENLNNYKNKYYKKIIK